MEKTSTLIAERNSVDGESSTGGILNTQVHLRFGRRGWQEVPERLAQTTYWATWKVVTVGLWKRVLTSRGPFSAVDERLVWQHWLYESNLGSADNIGQVRPGFVPFRLYKEVVRANVLSREDQARIKRECHLVVMSGSTVRNPHPLFEEALSAMNMKERYGVVTHSSINEMPYRVYEAYRIVSQSVNQINEQKRSLKELQQQAAEASRGKKR